MARTQITCFEAAPQAGAWTQGALRLRFVRIAMKEEFGCAIAQSTP